MIFWLPWGSLPSRGVRTQGTKIDSDTVANCDRKGTSMGSHCFRTSLMAGVILIAIIGLCCSPREKTSGSDVLLLINEPVILNLMVQLLDEHSITVVSTPMEVESILSAHKYRVLISTNFGLSAYEAIRIIPEKRDFPAIFVSGFWDEHIENLCKVENLVCVRAPFDPNAFQETVRTVVSNSIEREGEGKTR